MKIRTFKNQKSFTPLEISEYAMPKNGYKKFLTGLTLIEMMVAITIFSLMIGTLSSILISGVREQKRALANQKLLDETSYTLEYMSRAIRMARKQLAPIPNCSKTCLSSNGLNYETSGVSDLRFQNYNCICQRFFLEGGQLKEQKGWELMGGNPTGGTTLPLTSSNLQIDSLKFNLIGENQTDNLQSRVTIFLFVKSKTPEGTPGIKIQTTISQRNIDLQY